MAATIRFPNGVGFPEGLEATLLDEKGTWVCSNKEAEYYIHLETRSYLQYHGTDVVTPIESLATGVAKVLGAELIHHDPEPIGARGDLQDYL